MPVGRDHLKEEKKGDHGQVGKGRGLDAEESAEIERSQVDLSDAFFFLKKSPADEDAADGEEELNAPATKSFPGCIAVTSDAPGQIVG